MVEDMAEDEDTIEAVIAIFMMEFILILESFVRFMVVQVTQLFNATSNLILVIKLIPTFHQQCMPLIILQLTWQI